MDQTFRHAQRFENFLLAEDVDASAVGRLDHLAQPIGARAVSPARSGIGCQRVLKRTLEAGQDRGMAGQFHVFRHVRVPEFVFHPACVRRKMAQGGAGFRSAQDRSVAVEPLQHLQVVPAVHDVADWCVERELAAVHQYGRCETSDGLGHGENTENGIRIDLHRRGGIAGRVHGCDTVGVCGHADHEWHFLFLNGICEYGFDRHVFSPRYCHFLQYSTIEPQPHWLQFIWQYTRCACLRATCGRRIAMDVSPEPDSELHGMS